jgi:hypothetical protein
MLAAVICGSLIGLVPRARGMQLATPPYVPVVAVFFAALLAIVAAIGFCWPRSPVNEVLHLFGT